MKSCIFSGGRRAGVECLSHLISQQGPLGVEVVAALDSGNLPGSGHGSVSELAHQASIPVISMSDLSRVLPVDFLVSVQYDQIFSPLVLERVQSLAVNLHMAPLPEYRGSAQYAFAVMDRRDYFGVTLHEMTEEVDAGSILAERRFPIASDVFAYELYEQATQEAIVLFREALPDLFGGNLVACTQVELRDTSQGVLHTRSELANLSRIPNSLPLSEKLLAFRATYFPPFKGPILVEGDSEVILDLEWYWTALNEHTTERGR